MYRNMALVSWLCSPPTADLQNVLRKRTFLVTKTTHVDILSHKELSQFDIWAKLWGSILGNILVHFEQRRLSSSYDDEQFHNWFFYPFPPAFFSLTQVLLQQKYFCWSKYLSILGKIILWNYSFILREKEKLGSNLSSSSGEVTVDLNCLYTSVQKWSV